MTLKYFRCHNVITLPVTSRKVQQETWSVKDLGPLLEAFGKEKNLNGRKAQYTHVHKCIMYGRRVCIPKNYQKNCSKELHQAHLGIVKMKAIARSRSFLF